MTRRDKLIERLLKVTTDYEYDEARSLLTKSEILNSEM